MKKTLLVVTLSLFAFIVFKIPAVKAQAGSMIGNESTTTQTQTGDMQTEPVETILRGILNEQKVSTIQQLDLSKISDDAWERLGDAVMEAAHPGQAHEDMDQMMGGGNAGVYGILGSVTWIALIVFLVAGAYFFIKQADKK